MGGSWVSTEVVGDVSATGLHCRSQLGKEKWNVDHQNHTNRRRAPFIDASQGVFQDLVLGVCNLVVGVVDADEE
jgi:hypothetical protein